MKFFLFVKHIASVFFNDHPCLQLDLKAIQIYWNGISLTTVYIKFSIQDYKVQDVNFIGLPSVIYGRKLKRLLKEYYCIDVKVVFSSFKVKKYFSLKCHTPMPLMANVVYQFTCLRDANSTYIGKTIRLLATRVREHATSSSAIKEHLSSCTTCKDNYSCNSFKVIDSANSDFEVSIKEALHIKHRNPNLNKQLSTQGMSFMLKIFT